MKPFSSLALSAGLLASPAAALAAPPTLTVDLVAGHGRLSDGQPQAEAVDLLATWVREGGDVARAEVLQERKFGARGGVVALSYSREFDADWGFAGTAAAGHGGLNWARSRFDLELSRKWGASRAVVSRIAVYEAHYHPGRDFGRVRQFVESPTPPSTQPPPDPGEPDRSDRGLRLALVGYLPQGEVVEGGVILNVSQPGTVRSHMPFASVTWGRDRVQYLSLRLAAGTEAYQALGAGQQLVGFRSRSGAVAWRRWLGPDWGFSAAVEHYRNPSYERLTLAAGLFSQW